ncbi:patatin-like phospholipase family protein [Xanthovirga aplysinae]|uniref:patatin-like phospholipase family protein n=1 Tax=Xanthovirga aplysinae TaxID=2529853 RepID=UPI0012BC77CE|nr:patatin-like phospholipase family protein [Xanthovirga aplysinae]MTI32548.1 phospholipase [Xanthovirga aplysinae]
MNKKVALVLSSGGARGTAHIGVIEALEEKGFEIGSVAGSSMGAAVGGFFATGKLDLYKEWILQLDRLEFIKRIDFTLSWQGFIRGEKVLRELKEIIGDYRIEDLPIPFTAVAADIHHHKEVVIEKGSLFKAIRASIGIPTILTPFSYLGTDLVDGGIINPIPIEHVKRSPNDLLVVVDLNANVPYEKPFVSKMENNSEYNSQRQLLWDRWKSRWNDSESSSTGKEIKKPGYFDLVNHSFDVMQGKLSRLLLEVHQPDLIVKVSKEACGTFDFHRAGEMINAGKRAFYESFEEFEKRGLNLTKKQIDL